MILSPLLLYLYTIIVSISFIDHLICPLYSLIVVLSPFATDDFKLGATDFRSILNAMSAFHYSIFLHDSSIVVATEIWLPYSVCDCEIVINGLKLTQTWPFTTCGVGGCIFISNLIFLYQQILCLDTLDSFNPNNQLWIALSSKNRKILVIDENICSLFLTSIYL